MKKVLPYIIIILLILGVGGGLAWEFFGKQYMPTSDFMDYAAEMGLSENEYTITLNHELLDERAVMEDDHVYVSMDLVTQQMNSRFYWNEDEQQMRYTTPTQILIFTPDTETYNISAWDGNSEGDEGYVVVKMIDDKPYLASDYLTANTKIDFDVFTEPNRININTSWNEEEVITVSADTAIRYTGGIKGEVLRNAESGEELVLLDSYDDWTQVATDDGYIGWVATSSIRNQNTVTPEEPAFEAPEYTNIHRDYKINMGWHQVISESANSTLSDVLSSTSGINVLSPTWFYMVDTEGNVGCTASSDYVTTCHNQGIEVWALFSNEFSSGASSDRVFDSDQTVQLLHSSDARAEMISQLINDTLQYDIDGINVDFESITQEGAADYIEFIRELSIACRYNGIVLSVDNYVPAYTYYYNRREQGIVCDYVVIMGYDETTGGSDVPGPVASQTFVREGIEDTLAIVDASKVINGIPFYSRVWCTDSSGAVSSFACGMDEAEGYLTDHNAEIQYLEDIGLNYGSYVSSIDGNTYEIWLQDATSVEDEMKMIQNNDLAGVAEWKIGFESGEEIWSLIESYLQ